MLTTWSILTLFAKIPGHTWMVRVEKAGWGQVEPRVFPLPQDAATGHPAPQGQGSQAKSRHISAIAWQEKEASSRKVDSWPVTPSGAAC